MISFLPFGGPASATSFLIQGKPEPAPGQSPNTSVFITDNGYFRTLRIPLKRGRWFMPVEMIEAKHVVLINEELAHRYFPGEDPLGKKIAINMGQDIPPSEIIGIVGDIKHKSLQDQSVPSVYWPHPELPFPFMNIVARTKSDPMKSAPAAAGVIHQLDPEQPLADLRSLDEWLGDSTARAEFNMTLLAILSTVALILAVAGVYAVMAHGVLQRTQEIGIRMALGASTSDVFRLILHEGSKLIFAGVLIGSAATFLLTRFMKSMLYETSTSDPASFLVVTIVLTMTALAACWIPSRRAASVNPLLALHYE
jgi:putative ABC transport system permease protein